MSADFLRPLGSGVSEVSLPQGSSGFSAFAMSVTGTTTAGSAVVSGVSATGLSVGSLVAGAGVIPGTVITAVDGVAGTVTLSLPVSASGTPTLTVMQERTVSLGGGSAVWGTAVFNPSALVLNEVNATAGIRFTNALDLAGAARTISVGIGTATLSGNVSDSVGGAGLRKTGPGMLVVSGDAAYSGFTEALGGVLRFSGAVNPLQGAGARLVLNGGSVDLTADLAGTLEAGPLPGGLSAVGGNRQVSVNGAAGLDWGAAGFNPSLLVLNDVQSSGTLTVANAISLSGAGVKGLMVAATGLSNRVVLSGALTGDGILDRWGTAFWIWREATHSRGR
jgi:autotransporter-associated beta strand protein